MIVPPGFPQAISKRAGYAYRAKQIPVHSELTQIEILYHDSSHWPGPNEFGQIIYSRVFPIGTDARVQRRSQVTSARTTVNLTMLVAPNVREYWHVWLAQRFGRYTDQTPTCRSSWVNRNYGSNIVCDLAILNESPAPTCHFAYIDGGNTTHLYCCQRASLRPNLTGGSRPRRLLAYTCTGGIQHPF